jgi:hypothetical protein
MLPAAATRQATARSVLEQVRVVERGIMVPPPLLIGASAGAERGGGWTRDAGAQPAWLMRVHCQPAWLMRVDCLTALLLQHRLVRAPAPCMRAPERLEGAGAATCWAPGDDVPYGPPLGAQHPGHRVGRGCHLVQRCWRSPNLRRLNSASAWTAPLCVRPHLRLRSCATKPPPRAVQRLALTSPSSGTLLAFTGASCACKQA